jgi:hypothetical protein
MSGIAWLKIALSHVVTLRCVSTPRYYSWFLLSKQSLASTWWSLAQIRYGACAFHAGYLRLQTHTQYMQYLLLFHCNDGCMNSPQYYVTRGFFSPVALRPSEGQGLLILEVSRSHSLDVPQPVGLIWTSDQLVAETSTWQHTTLKTDKHPCPRRDSNLQSWQASGCRPTPQTARPLRPARYKYLM